MGWRKTKDSRATFFTRTSWACKRYCQHSRASLWGLSELFGNYRLLGYIAFALQPLLAIGQIIFGYSIVFTLAYMLTYNYILFRRAKKKRSMEDK